MTVPEQKERKSRALNYYNGYNRYWNKFLIASVGKRGAGDAALMAMQYIDYCYEGGEEPDPSTLSQNAQRIFENWRKTCGEDVQRSGELSRTCIANGKKGGAPIGNQNARKEEPERTDNARTHPQGKPTNGAQRSEGIGTQHPAMVEAESETVYHIRPTTVTFFGEEMEDDNLWWWCDAGTNGTTLELIRKAVASGFSWHDITQRTLKDATHKLPMGWDDLQRGLRNKFTPEEIQEIEPFIIDKAGVQSAQEALKTISGGGVRKPIAYMRTVLQLK